MFNVPEWENDIPNTSDNLNRLFQGTKRKNKVNTPSKPKESKLKKKVFKSKAKVTNEKNKTFINNIKKKSPKHENNNKSKQIANRTKIKKIAIKNGNVSNTDETNKVDHSIEIQNYNADNLDEIILNAKKDQLVALYQNEDNEEALFTESESNKKANVIPENTIKQSQNKLKRKMLNGIDKDNVKSHKNQNKDQTEIDVQGQNKTNKNQTEIIKNTIKKCNDDAKKTIIKSNKKILNKKQLFKTLLDNNKQRNILSIDTGNKLRERMLDRLNAAKFRFLNERLYTSSGSEAQKLFVVDPVAFQTYHQGYQQQVKKWPVNPLDIVVKRIINMPKTHLIADLGCGEAGLAKAVPHKVRSFDLVATAPGVEVCDMAHTPLLASSMDVAVYCLALMGTDLTQYLREANRILKVGGHLLIAEVESRFDNVDTFTKDVQRLGFSLKKLDNTQKVFFFMEFVKAREAPVKKSKLPTMSLKPCIYKKR